MSNPNKIPTYRLHKQSGQAITTLVDGLGGRRDVLLGKYNCDESKQEYDRVITEWKLKGRRLPGQEARAGLSINELILAYKPVVEGYYRHPDGTPTSEAKNIRQAFRFLRELYGHTQAHAFDSLGLDALRLKMIEAGLCRNSINKDVSRIAEESVVAFKLELENERRIPRRLSHEQRLAKERAQEIIDKAFREGRLTPREQIKVINNDRQKYKEKAWERERIELLKKLEHLLRKALRIGLTIGLLPKTKAARLAEVINSALGLLPQV
jgi:hypothetical protein